MLPDREKLNRIEDLKTKLFSKDFKTRTDTRGIFSSRRSKDVPESWEGEKNDESKGKVMMKASMFKNFFIFSIGFFILAIGFAIYMFFAGGNSVSNDNIDITVLGNTFTAGGEDLPLQIEVTNKNHLDLELADLVVQYPKGSSSDLSQDTESLRNSLGTIASGEVKSENVKVILFGEQGSVRPIKISLEYRVSGSNAIFVKEVPYQVSISSAPIDLLIDAPTEVSPDQEVTLNMKATLNATKTASDMLLRFDYPVGFQFESANPSPSFGNNTWSLGDLAPGAEKDISVTGKMIGVSDGEEKTFHVFSGSVSDSDKSVIGVVFNSLAQTINIKKPFIEAKLYINGEYQDQYATDTKSAIFGEIRWANNLDTKVEDLQITAKISGNAVNQKTISAQQGFFDSSSNTITWDKNSKGDFSEVNPGDSGSVSFSLSSLSLFAASTGMLTDPTVNIDVSITGKQPLEGNAVTNLTNSESKVIKIISDVGLAAKALYYSGAFSNTGPIPPVVGSQTTYTIIWALSNTANDISKAQIHATLPQWMNFVGPVSPSTEDLTYDPSTQGITWNAGGIPKGTGITEADREVSFQVSLNPSLSQVDTTPVIINDAVLTGHDDFANVDIQVNKTALSTRLSNDSLFPANGDRVVAQ